jgi:RNA polymerase sigma-70 factor (ECF subfamily)
METRSEVRWARLAALLEPIHQQAVATARRLCGSSAEGDDLFQDTVLRVFEKLHTLRDESRFRSWFYVTLLSVHRTRMRRSFWRRLLPWDRAFPEGSEPAGADRSEWGEAAGRAARIRRALDSLPLEQRQAIVLFELDGFSIEEIAHMQSASVPAVKSRLTRGRGRLRQWYRRQGLAGPAADPTTEPAQAASARSVAAFIQPEVAMAEQEERAR